MKTPLISTEYNFQYGHHQPHDFLTPKIVIKTCDNGRIWRKKVWRDLARIISPADLDAEKHDFLPSAVVPFYYFPLFPKIHKNRHFPPFLLFPSNNKYLIKNTNLSPYKYPLPISFPPYKYSHPLPSEHSIPTKTSPVACVDQLRGFYIIHPNTIMLLNVVYLRRHSRSIWRCQNDTLC